jgi:hypothetical protein
MMDCYTAAGTSMPVNVAFILEGEEEHGSLGFRQALEQNLHWLEDTSLVRCTAAAGPACCCCPLWLGAGCCLCVWVWMWLLAAAGGRSWRRGGGGLCLCLQLQLEGWLLQLPCSCRAVAVQLLVYTAQLCCDQLGYAALEACHRLAPLTSPASPPAQLPNGPPAHCR